MSLLVSGEGFVLHPEGVTPAKCIAVRDIGICETPFGERRKVETVFRTAERKPNGKHFELSRRYNATLTAKSALSKDLSSWLRHTFTPAEIAAGYDLEQLIGGLCRLVVTHNTRDGMTYADIEKILPPAADDDGSWEGED
jgi:hypothetical protein